MRLFSVFVSTYTGQFRRPTLSPNGQGLEFKMFKDVPFLYAQFVDYWRYE